MVTNIQGFSPTLGTGSFRSSQPLTDDQKSQVQSILSNYDPSSITAADAKDIFKAFRDAGIQPGDDLKQAISDAGFDPEKLRSLAFPRGGHHHRQSQDQQGTSSSSNQINLSTLQSLQSILDQYDLTNLSPDQQTELLSKLNDAGLMKSGTTINLSA